LILGCADGLALGSGAALSVGRGCDGGRTGLGLGAAGALSDALGAGESLASRLVGAAAVVVGESGACLLGCSTVSLVAADGLAASLLEPAGSLLRVNASTAPTASAATAPSHRRLRARSRSDRR
jgi:hypothetical protein